MLKKRWLVTAASSFLMATLVATPAAAHFQFDVDYNDESTPLDIFLSGVNHSGRLVWGGAVMVNRFRNALLGKKGDVFFDFDSKGGRKADYYVSISKEDGKLKAFVWKYTKNSSRKVARGVAWRYDNKTVNFIVRKRSVRAGGGFFRWYASTRYSNGVDRYGRPNYRWDYSPDSGMKGHSSSVAGRTTSSVIPEEVLARIQNLPGFSPDEGGYAPSSGSAKSSPQQA